MRTRFQVIDPSGYWSLAIFDQMQHGPGSMDELLSQVSVFVSRNAEQLRISTGRNLLGNQATRLRPLAKLLPVPIAVTMALAIV